MIPLACKLFLLVDVSVPTNLATGQSCVKLGVIAKPRVQTAPVDPTESSCFQCLPPTPALRNQYISSVSSPVKPSKNVSAQVRTTKRTNMARLRKHWIGPLLANRLQPHTNSGCRKVQKNRFSQLRRLDQVDHWRFLCRRHVQAKHVAEPEKKEIQSHREQKKRPANWLHFKKNKKI